MIVLMIVILVCLGIVGTGHVVHGINQKKAKQLDSKVGLSEVGKALVKEYNALPLESRPFDDIVPMVKALDIFTAADTKERGRHFDQNWLPITGKQNGFYEFDWNARGGDRCAHHHCKFHEYARLHRAIEDVTKSLAEKERAVLESRYSGDREALDDLTQRLRSEAEINRSFIREFKEL